MNKEDLIHSIKNDDSIDIIIGYYKNDLEKINIIKELAILRIKLEEYGYSIINLDLICDINKLNVFQSGLFDFFIVESCVL